MQKLASVTKYFTYISKILITDIHMANGWAIGMKTYVNSVQK